MQRSAGRFERIAAMVALGLGLFLAWLLWSGTSGVLAVGAARVAFRPAD